MNRHLTEVFCFFENQHVYNWTQMRILTLAMQFKFRKIHTLIEQNHILGDVCICRALGHVSYKFYVPM